MKKNKKIEATQVEQAEANKPNRFLFLLIGFLTFFVFANTIGNDYNMDDELVTRNHPLTSQGMKAIGEIFTSPYYKDDMGYAYGYRPIVHVSFAIEHELFGEKASVSHFVNVILYVACVLLFLSLLLKWIGEQNKWIAIIAVLFFALHPIHTEVVASIKNRDELLAFLCAMLAGLSMIKFIEREKWISLFWIALFFSLGMLSKKSIYSMTVIFPISAILINSISWKKLIYILVVFSVPTALISSESSLSRFGLLLMIPWLGSFVFYYFREKLLSGESFVKSIIEDFNFWAGITVLISFYGIYNYNYFIIPAIIILSYYCFYINSNKGVIIVSFIAAIIGFRFNLIEFAYFGFVILGYFTFSLFSKKEKTSILNISVLVIITTILFILNPIINQVSSIFTLAVFIWLLNKKIIFGVLFSSVVLIIAYLISHTISNFGIIMFPFSLLLLLVSVYFKSAKLIRTIPLLAIIPVFFVSHISSQYKISENVNIYTNSNTKSEINANKTILKESRPIEYVENTLVAKHLTSETIGTGLSTIGEYAKLMVFPYELSFYYGFSKTKTTGMDNTWVWFSLIFYLVLIALSIWQLKKRPILFIGVAWYLLSILLFINWFELVAGMVGERLAFTASAGFSVFLAGLVFWTKPDFNLKRPKILELSVIVVLILFSIRTVSRNSDWKDPLTLMGNDIKHLQNSAQANNLYALFLMKALTKENNFSETKSFELKKIAAKHFKKAFSIYPNFKNAYYDYGRVNVELENEIEALYGFQMSIKLNPEFTEAYLQLIKYTTAKNKLKLANKVALKWLEFNRSPDSYIVLAQTFFNLKQYNKSLEILKTGLIYFPNDRVLIKSKNELEKFTYIGF